MIDVVKVLTESTYANRYWSDLKRKLAQEAGTTQAYEKIVSLKLTAPDGKQRATDCATAKDLLRIVQSIPSPKAELIKRWLAKVGYELALWKEYSSWDVKNKRNKPLAGMKCALSAIEFVVNQCGVERKARFGFSLRGLLFR